MFWKLRNLAIVICAFLVSGSQSFAEETISVYYNERPPVFNNCITGERSGTNCDSSDKSISRFIPYIWEKKKLWRKFGICLHPI